MKRKKKSIGYKKERVILSDVLPYELPLAFSNRGFYEFLTENGIEFRGDNICWKKRDTALDVTIRLLFGAEANAKVVTSARQVLGKQFLENRFEKLSRDFFVSLPFRYKIQHKDTEFRELTICHPRNQIQVVELYHSYKELILYYCGISPFSIRKPTRVSRYIFHRDKVHYGALSDESVGVEESEKEYENLRSFFVYKDYSHIFKFYESYRFHRCEKKYNKLLRLDVGKCFDSIYTHSLAWALLNKETVKENIPKSCKTFGGRFDKLMQQMNDSETNGIIIGPEFSRIFAELILQSVDRALCLDLECDSRRHFHKKDFEIFRYVDDYFVFYNEEKIKDAIVQLLQVKLKDYKLHLNSAKAVSFEKPIITNISMAKHRIEKLLNEKLAYKVETVQRDDESLEPQGAKRRQKRGSIHINSNGLTTQFKTIIKESEVEYRDTLNYALAIVEGRSSQIILDYDSLTNETRNEKQVGQAILAICDFTFFIYSVSPRVNTTIRLCRILEIFTSFLKRGEINPDLRHSVFKLISDNICLILDKNKDCEHTPVETLYLLTSLSELGREYWLEEEVLASYFAIKFASGSKSFIIPARLNYLCLVVLLFYVRNRARYEGLRKSIEAAIKDRFEKKKTTARKDTELILLLFDSLTCPYITRETKGDILAHFGVDDRATQDAVIAIRTYWFTKWIDFNFSRELDAKRGLEVY